MIDQLRADLLARIVDAIPEGVYSLDGDGRITFWNKGAERISGYAREETIGTKRSEDFLRRTDGKDRGLCLEGCPMTAATEDCRPREDEIFLRHKDGHRVPILVRSSPILDPAGQPVGAIEIFSDHSERSTLLAELETLKKEILSDQLTGLGNRRFVAMNAEAAFRELEEKGTGFGLLILDIDHFKAVNDQFGHAIGDRVLRMIAWTLANVVRRNDAAARWGGEEFIVICPRIDAGALAVVAERARSLVSRSGVGLEDGRKAVCTVSIGGAMARPGDTLESLIARADERLYDCKAAGRNRALVGD